MDLTNGNVQDSLSGDNKKTNESSITSHLRAGSKEIFNLACQNIDEFGPDFSSPSANNSKTLQQRKYSFGLRAKDNLFNKLEENLEEGDVNKSKHGSIVIDNQLTALDIHLDANQLQDELKGKKRYQLWQGNNVFLCYGRIMLGVHVGHLSLSVTLIAGTWITFVFLLAPFTQNNQAYTTFMACFFLFLNMSLLISTATTEPGIIPPKQNQGQIQSPLSPRSQNQFCVTCNIQKPKRAKHCRHCNNCVEVFDHHCPWTGTCIGVRNYGHFISFVTSIVISAFYVLGTVIYIIIGWFEGLSCNAPIFRGLAIILGLLWSLMIILLVGMLLMFHLFLIIRGQTTSEFLRGAPIADTTTHCCSRKTTKLLPMWDVYTDDESDDEHAIEMNDLVIN